MEAPSQVQASASQDASVGRKLDTLLSVVKDICEILKQQDHRLQKQKERASFHDMSMVPSGHSSPK